MDIAGFSYAIIKARRPEEWRFFGEQVVGMSAHDVPGGLALRMDERAGRLFIEQGAEDRYFASGWEIRSEPAFEAALARLQAAGTPFHKATTAEIAIRHVFDMVWFLDPSGNRHELALGYATSFDRFQSPVGVPAFVTGDLGLGHLVLPAPDIHATRAFLCEVMEIGRASCRERVSSPV